MKFQMLATALSVLFLSSCSTVYKCGETRPEKFSANKKVTALVNERDLLCTTLDVVNNEKSNLEIDLAEKSQALVALEERYNDLESRSSKTAEELSAELQAKSNELRAEIARRDSITNRLNSTLRAAFLGFDDDELSLEVKNGKVYVSMSDKLLFKSGSQSVQEKGQEAIQALAGVLAKNTTIDILIEGHTDNVPIKTANYKDNWDLSVARATSIIRLLADKHKLEEKRLTAAGCGEFQPRASNDTPEGRAQNRRTEIILSPKLDELMNLIDQQ